MILLDVNVLITAFWPDAHRHEAVSRWLTAALSGRESIGVPDLVATAFVRLVTNHRVFTQPAESSVAVDFVEALLARPAASVVTASTRHWPLLRDLVLDLDLRANDLTDAHLAALALDRGAALATLDRGFARFRRLRLVEPVIEEPLPG